MFFMVENNFFLQLQLVHDTFITRPALPEFWVSIMNVQIFMWEKNKCMKNDDKRSTVECEFKERPESKQKSDFVNEYEWSFHIFPSLSPQPMETI